MGTSRRPRPARLAEKLQEIRTNLGLTQAEMFERLGDTGTRLYVGHIDDYEKDRRVPTLQVVLAYARAAGVTVEQLIDDALTLDAFDQLPAPKVGRVKRRRKKA
jgi:transcriptional regulator with XRE-family HTH domain